MGTLSIVSTPIGNMEDITVRAMRILTTVDIIACEDTRRTGLLLEQIAKNYQTPPHKAKLISYFDENELGRIPQLLQLLQSDKNVALVSDAGTPAISDPGFKLIRACREAGIRIEAIPGASSALAALVISGLPTDKFTFIGYLPHKTAHRKHMLENIAESQKSIKSTIILFEAPHKLVTSLMDMHEMLGNIKIVVCRELTKVYEEVLHVSVEEAIIHFSKNKPRGEFVLLFNLN